jgi:hypothetical protein
VAESQTPYQSVIARLAERDNQGFIRAMVRSAVGEMQFDEPAWLPLPLSPIFPNMTRGEQLPSDRSRKISTKSAALVVEGRQYAEYFRRIEALAQSHEHAKRWDYAGWPASRTPPR